MKKKQGKAQSKKEEEERLQKEQQEKQEVQKKVRERQQFLQDRSSPLIQWGLLDAFENFMVELTEAGIPQGNVYEFAAQTVLRFEKNMKKKRKNKAQLERFNEQVIKQSPSVNNKKRNGKTEMNKPKLLPFKQELTEQQKAIIDKKAE